MKPRIFVSSTIKDLHFLREALREMFVDLGYEPVLSEHNGVPYLPDVAPAESCFKAVRSCDIAIVIVSRRYGDGRVRDANIGITHNEYRTARSAGIPVYFLIDRDIHVMKEVWDENKSTDFKIDWPGIDHPDEVFRFASEAASDGAYYCFSTAEEACAIIRYQLAYLFRELLMKQRTHASSEQKSILQELAFVRKQLESAFPNQPMPQSFVTATSLFVEDSYKQLRHLMNRISRGIESSVTELLRYSSFDEYLSQKGVTVRVTEERIILDDSGSVGPRYVYASMFTAPQLFRQDGGEFGNTLAARQWCQYGLTDGNELVVNVAARDYLADLYKSVREASLTRDDA